MEWINRAIPGADDEPKDESKDCRAEAVTKHERIARSRFPVLVFQRCRAKVDACFCL
jgi:hypothetical protein